MVNIYYRPFEISVSSLPRSNDFYSYSFRLATTRSGKSEKLLWKLHPADRIFISYQAVWRG